MFQLPPTLEYRRPVALQRQAHEETLPDLEIPESELATYVRHAFRYGTSAAKTSDPEVRNQLVWFLVAAGVQTQQVAQMFEISASRCRSIATRAAKQTLESRFHNPSGPFSKGIKSAATPSEREIMALHYRQIQMMGAEYMLRHHAGDPLIKKCLHLGREQFAAAFADLTVTRCGCSICKAYPNTERPYHAIWIYWTEEAR